MPAFIFITKSGPEFERKSDKDRKALSKTTCNIHIKDGEPSLRLPSCSHSSGSSSTFHETNKNVKVFFFLSDDINSKYCPHLISHIVVTLERPPVWARPQSSSGGCCSERPGNIPWSACRWRGPGVGKSQRSVTALHRSPYHAEEGSCCIRSPIWLPTHTARMHQLTCCVNEPNTEQTALIDVIFCKQMMREKQYKRVQCLWGGKSYILVLKKNLYWVNVFLNCRSTWGRKGIANYGLLEVSWMFW